MDIIQNKLTGCRLVGTITALGDIGPKHHGIILGQSDVDGKNYVAESMCHGYRLAELDDFIKRYRDNSPIKVCPNDGKLSNIEVASRALDEINRGGNGKYNLIFNNCESFVNRAMYGTSLSSQVLNVCGLLIIFIGGICFIKKTVKA